MNTPVAQNYVPPAYQQLPASTKPWEVGPIAGSPFPTAYFPAGSYIDGMGSVVTPTVTRAIGGLGN
jgi:hypothetical protein